jgi:hypothetical protein
MSFPVVHGVCVFDWNVTWTKWSDFGNASVFLPVVNRRRYELGSCTASPLTATSTCVGAASGVTFGASAWTSVASSPFGCHHAGCWFESPGSTIRSEPGT